MMGEPIEAVRNGVQLLASTLRSDPYALETAFLSVITFDEEAKQVVPLTELTNFQPPTIEAGTTTSLGEALRVTKECIEREVQTTTSAELYQQRSDALTAFVQLISLEQRPLRYVLSGMSE